MARRGEAGSRTTTAGWERAARGLTPLTIVALIAVATPGPAQTPSASPLAQVIEQRILSKQPGRYIGWPTIAATRDGELLVVFSGDRSAHVSPDGKTQLIRSDDSGATWTAPVTIHDFPVDDRDAGILCTSAGTLIVSWFTGPPYGSELEGHYVRRSVDGGLTWSEPIRTATSTPHGPIQLADGRLLMVGQSPHCSHARPRDYNGPPDGSPYRIAVEESRDDGRSWQVLGEFPVPADARMLSFDEPHIVETADRRIVALFRDGNPPHRLWRSESADGGRTWSTPARTPLHGYPAHLTRLRSGWLLATYGRRWPPFGQFASLSPDGGRTWLVEQEIQLSSAPNGDLGYPASVELEDGTIWTVYYEVDRPGEPPCLKGTRWRLSLPPPSALAAPDPIVDALGPQRARVWRPRLLPGHDEFVFTLYGTPGEPERLRRLIEVLRRERLANGFDPGPSPRPGSRALFEVIAAAGWPVICYPGASDMQVKDGSLRLDDDDEESTEPLERAGVFHAVQLGEWGYYFHNLSSSERWWRAVYGDAFESRRSQMKPPGLSGFDAVPASRREAYEVVRDYYLTRDLHLRGRNFSVTGHSHYEAYVAEWGSPLIGLELAENIGYTQSKIAFARGASRRWGRPWSGQVSPWFHGSCTTRGALRREGEHARGLDAGHSLSLYERMWLHLWFAGAAMVTPENSIDIFFEDDSEWRLTTHGEKAREVFAFARAHDRGVPFTPVAIVLDRYAGYNAYKARPWGIFQPSAGDLEIRDLFQEQLFPGSDSIHGPPVPGDPEARYLRPTPFGESFDVLLSNAGADVLSTYPIVLLVGDIDFDTELVRDLHRVLRSGTRVLISARHARDLGERLSPLRGSGDLEVLEPWTNPATARPTAIASSRLGELVASVTPITVSGDDVQWQLNRNRTGWVVEVVHDRGVTKRPTEPAVIDPEARVEVTLRCSEAWTTARRWRGSTPLRVAPDRSVRLELGPGEVEFVEWVLDDRSSEER